jgi:hypothetical protein
MTAAVAIIAPLSLHSSSSGEAAHEKRESVSR